MTSRPSLAQIPNSGNERDLLGAFLDYYRAALIDRAAGLTAEQMKLRLAPSRLSLAGLIGHMALVEQNWFQDRFDGEGYGPPWKTDDFQISFDDDRDAEMTLSESWTTEQLHDVFASAVTDARRRTDAAESLDQLSKLSDKDGEPWNLRWILIHMIEEYARHCGHADLIRESIDGDTAPDD